MITLWVTKVTTKRIFFFKAANEWNHIHPSSVEKFCVRWHFTLSKSVSGFCQHSQTMSPYDKLHTGTYTHCAFCLNARRRKKFRWLQTAYIRLYEREASFIYMHHVHSIRIVCLALFPIFPKHNWPLPHHSLSLCMRITNPYRYLQQNRKSKVYRRINVCVFV